MAKRKTPADMTDHELETAYETAWSRYRLFGAELNRRKLIQEYGTDTPELTDYSVEISVTCPLTVQAKSQDDAERLVLDWVCLTDERYDQITYDDIPEITIDGLLWEAAA
jgi:hypothetical protein